MVAFEERFPVLDYAPCHGTVTNSISSQPECDETWLRLHSGSARQRDEALVRLMEANQNFRDSSEAFAKTGGTQELTRGFEDCIADCRGWALDRQRDRETEQVQIEGV